MQSDYKKRVFGLDLMRAIAILLLVFSHLLWIAPETTGLIKDLMSLAGVMGVEIFFVLSGFLIGRIIYKLFLSEHFSKRKLLYFWARRWFRTLPNYYLVLILNIILCTYIGMELPKELWQYFFFIQNFYWEMPWFFPESWSLSIEEFAYILGPLILYCSLLFFNIKNKSRLFLLVTFGIISLFLMTKVEYNSQTEESDIIFWNTHLKAVVMYRLDAIYYGVLAAYFSLVFEKKWLKLRVLFLYLGIIIFLGINYLIPNAQLLIQQHPFFWNVLYLPINSVAIAFCLPWLSSWKRAPKIVLVPVTLISLVSYAMYLLHYSVIMQLMKYYLPSEGLPKFDLIIYILVYLAITVLSSYLLYKLFEKPMMDLRDKNWVVNRFN